MISSQSSVTARDPMSSTRSAIAANWSVRHRPRAARFPFFNVDFSTMTTCGLVVCGDMDNPHFTTRGPEWHADAFHDAPGAVAMLMMHGVGHGLGGIAALNAKETETNAPAVLQATRRLTLARLQTALGVDEGAWQRACLALAREAAPLETVKEARRSNELSDEGLSQTHNQKTNNATFEN